jgi:fumarate hydratase, class I
MDETLIDQVVELIKRASTDLPPDVVEALRQARDKESGGSMQANTFETILKNIDMARDAGTPICQDTGMCIFYVYHPVGTDTIALRKYLEAAAEKATKEILLRPNAVDPITGKNSGTNVGTNAPYVVFKPWEKDEIEIKLMLKGGGSENVGKQYTLPDSRIGAGRDLKGVRKCVLDAVYSAQGKGCGPGTVGVGIGGDRGSAFFLSKEQFFRKLGSTNSNTELAALEDGLHEDLNTLGIGPMGFGGKTTVLDVFIGTQHRHPATFYVSVSYICWAFRRKTMTLKNGEVTYND